MSGFGWPSGGGGSLNVTKEEKVVEDVLFEETLIADGVFSFPNIPQGYDDLLIEGLIRSNNNAPTDAIEFTLNGDTTEANYNRERMGSQDGIINGVNTNDRNAFFIVADTGEAGVFSSARITIQRHSEANADKIIGIEYRSKGIVHFNSLRWNNTSAVTDVALAPTNGTGFKSGSKLRVTGRKKQQIVTDVSME